MGNLWAKIKLWTKGIVFGVLCLYAAFFIVENLGNRTKVWLVFGYDPDLPILIWLIFAFFTGVITNILVRAARTALRQLRELKERTLMERIQREHEQKLARAEALNAKPADPSSGHSGAPPGETTTQA